MVFTRNDVALQILSKFHIITCCMLFTLERATKSQEEEKVPQNKII